MKTVRKKMCDLLTFGRSNRNIADDHPPGPYPLFGMKGVEKCVNFHDSAEPFIGLTVWGRIGEVKKLPAKSSTVSSIAIVKPKEGIDLNYLYYMLKSFNFRKYRVSLWAPKIRFNDWKDEEVEIIENVEDQKIVAGLLDKIGELKEEQKKKAEKLEKFKKGLINLIFTPYGDSIRFRWYKSNISLKALDELITASSGMLKPVRLREVITLNNAGRIRMSSWERSYGNIPYYGSNGVIDYVDTVTHDGSYVLVAENGAVSLDNYPIHLSEDRKICASDHVHVVSGKNKIDLTYMYFLLKASRFHRWITGGTRYRLNANALLDVKTYVHTSRKDQKAIGLLLSRAEQLASKAKEKEQLIQSLEENFLFFLKSVDRQKK